MSRKIKSTAEELRQIEEANTAWLAGLLDRIAELYLLSAPKAEIAQAEDDLARAIARAMETADLLGRRRLALEINAATGAREYAVPVVPFEEAIEDILNRHPAVREGWEATRDYYLDGGFAIARSSSEEVTKHVQGQIKRAMQGGQTGQDAITGILRKLRGQDDERWTFGGSYAETVYRTNVASSYTRGRLEQARDPVFRRQVAAWEFRTYPGPDVRENHAAMRGVVAAIDDPIWRTMAPPLGYNCRCSLEFVSFREARKFGAVDEEGSMVPAKIPAGAFPDPGFKG